MMPLWMTTTLPARCGCAFCSDGRPCVAQRVWPMPERAARAAARAAASRGCRACRRQRRTSIVAVVERGDAGRVVAAVLEPLARPCDEDAAARHAAPTYPTMPHISVRSRRRASRRRAPLRRRRRLPLARGAAACPRASSDGACAPWRAPAPRHPAGHHPLRHAAHARARRPARPRVTVVPAPT